VETAAKHGDLIPLSSLEVGFGYFNESRTRLAYAEALSAVTYLVDTYGSDGLAALLAAYRQGMVTDEVFPAALGVTATEFEAGWTVWLGLSEGEFVTNTPWPLPTFPPSPTPRLPGTAVATTPKPRATAVTQLLTPTSTAVPIGPSQFPFGENQVILAAIGGFVLLLCCLTAVILILVFIWWQRQQHR
jgi:hypothetical protein